MINKPIEFDTEMIGDNIYKYRSRAGLTQKELGKLIGVESSTISVYERSMKQPSINAMEKLAKALNITVDHLFSDGVCDMDENKLAELRAFLLKMNPEQEERFADLVDYVADKYTNDI